MISRSEMSFASTRVIAMKSNSCSRFPGCPRAGGGGRPICFEGPSVVRRMQPNQDVARWQRSGAAKEPKLSSGRMESEIRIAARSEAKLVSEILTEAAGWLEARGIPLWSPDQVSVRAVSSEVQGGLYFLAWLGGVPVGTMRLTASDPAFWPKPSPARPPIHLASRFGPAPPEAKPPLRLCLWPPAN